VLAELRRLRSQEPAQEDVASARRELKGLERQERRLVELYVDGSFNKDVLDEQQAVLRSAGRSSMIGCGPQAARHGLHRER
jgi:FixJ family two-component response regulator